MMPTTLMEIFILIFIFIGINILALFLLNFQKPLRILSWIILLLGISFYSIRPFIVDFQIESAIEDLDTHLKKEFPNEEWEITDADDYKLKSEKYLYVIFDNESNVIYEYKVNKQMITQVDMWTKSGSSLESENSIATHKE